MPQIDSTGTVKSGNLLSSSQQHPATKPIAATDSNLDFARRQPHLDQGWDYSAVPVGSASVSATDADVRGHGDVPTGQPIVANILPPPVPAPPGTGFDIHRRVVVTEVRKCQ